MRFIYVLLFFILVSFKAFSQSEVQIGTQIWMTKNLDVDRFRNGDKIPEAKTEKEWKSADANKKPAWCYYDNDPANGEKYGKLYNWYAATDPRGLAPKGWRIPSGEDWSILIYYLSVSNALEGKAMKSKTGWRNHHYYGYGYSDGNGTNTSGFSGLPGGKRMHFGDFHSVGTSGHWWTSKKVDKVMNWSCYLSNNHKVVGWSADLEGDGLSVRCIKD